MNLDLDFLPPHHVISLTLSDNLEFRSGKCVKKNIENMNELSFLSVDGIAEIWENLQLCLMECCDLSILLCVLCLSI